MFFFTLPKLCLLFLLCLFFTRGQFWPLDVVVACVCVCVSIRPSVCQSRSCPRDNSWPVQARIIKFGLNVKKHIDQGPCCFEGQLILTFLVKFNLKLKFYPILSLKFVRAITHPQPASRWRLFHRQPGVIRDFKSLLFTLKYLSWC